MGERTLEERPSTEALASTVAASIPRLKHDLARLVGIPSISAPNYPESTHGALLEAYEEVVALCRDAGVQILDPLQLPDTAPVVIGEIPAPPGVPTLTVALRGMAMVTVEARTLAGPKHSGQFGGAAPDALIALLHALSSLHDEHGDVTVPGLRREEW